MTKILGLEWTVSGREGGCEERAMPLVTGASIIGHEMVFSRTRSQREPYWPDAVVRPSCLSLSFIVWHGDDARDRESCVVGGGSGREP